MKCNLDKKKAEHLRGLINKDPYAFMYDLDIYYKLCTIMDRLEDTVSLLNNFELPIQKNQFNATDFIAWINYADLIVNCIYTLNDLYVVPNNTSLFQNDDVPQMTKYKKPFRNKFLGQYYKNDSDDNFFKFLRSLVLAHSLKIDCNRFSNFTHQNYAYSPMVRWNEYKNLVEITYYIPDFNIKTQNFYINPQDVIDYLESRYNFLDEIFPYITIEKEKEKQNLINTYTNEFSHTPNNLKQKLEYIDLVFTKNGDIDAKNKADIMNYYIELFANLLNIDFSSTNTIKIELFKDLINVCADDFIDTLKSQDEKESLASELFQHYNYNDDRGKFSDCPYEINKIYEDYKYCMINERHFNQYYEIVKSRVAEYFTIEESMDLPERVALCVIALCFDNLIYRIGILEKLPTTIGNKVREIYEIQI